MRSLNSLRTVRKALIDVRNAWFRAARGVAIDRSAQVSLSARFVDGGRNSISIGEDTLIAFRALVIARSPSGEVRAVRIGRNCFIGGGSTILPGVTIGDGSIVGANAVVFEDVPPDTIVGGNPARVLKTGISAGPLGVLQDVRGSRADLYRAD